MPRGISRLEIQELTPEEQLCYQLSAYMQTKDIARAMHRKRGWVQNTLRRIERNMGYGYRR